MEEADHLSEGIKTCFVDGETWLTCMPPCLFILYGSVILHASAAPHIMSEPGQRRHSLLGGFTHILPVLSHRSTSSLHATVRTTRGVVTVGGRARNATEIDLVSKLVTDIKGVKSVNNRMTIGESK